MYRVFVASKKNHSSLSPNAHPSEWKTKIKNNFLRSFSFGIPADRIRSSLFIFFVLLFFSTGFFVVAGDEGASEMSIFEDADQDGLSNDEENLYGTDPSVRDSDDDGYSDGVEVGSGYDPLKKAPGDRIVQRTEESTYVEGGVGGDNLTEKVTQEIADVIKSVNDGDKSVSMDQVNEAVEKALDGNMEEVVLPEVDISEIRVKKTPGDEDKLKKDVLEYVTVMAYMMANSSTQEFSTEKDVENIITSVADESASALLSGNMEYLNKLGEQGETILTEAKSIEVPEVMLETHVKALRLATYATALREELTPSQEDPLGLIAVLSKAEGLVAVSESFSQEILAKLEEYGIEGIPLNF